MTRQLLWILVLPLAVSMWVAASACDDEPGDDRLDPGIWVAMPPQHVRLDPLQPGKIRVFDVISGTERTFGPKASYFAVAWSPAGDRLAAIGISESPKSNIFVRIWDASGDVVRTLEFAEDDGGPQDIAWSPDGTRLALPTRFGVTMLDRDGKELGKTLATPDPDGGWSNSSGGAFEPWSPDSKHYAVQSRDLLMVVDRDGRGGEYELPPEGARPPSSSRFMGWNVSGAVTLLRSSELTRELLSGSLTGGRIDWDDGKPFDLTTLVPDAQRIQRLEQLVPGRSFYREVASAEGTARVSLLFERDADYRRGAVPVWIVIDRSEGSTVVDLGHAQPVGGPRFPVDVIVILGWKGDVPKAVAAARPLPTARPTPTERPITTISVPTFSGTPVPYPAPRGERVQAQVRDLTLVLGKSMASCAKARTSPEPSRCGSPPTMERACSLSSRSG